MNSPPRVDALGRERLADQAAEDVVADRADEGRAPAKARVAAARVPSGLPDSVGVVGEIALDDPVD
ncbi:hypothetical protein WMF37_15385 [Sorangium sp. So ce291]